MNQPLSPIYGRKIVHVELNGQRYKVLSGQWVGHRYGHPMGTSRQQDLLLAAFMVNLRRIGFVKPTGYPQILWVEKKIRWQAHGKWGGCTGDIITE